MTEEELARLDRLDPELMQAYGHQSLAHLDRLLNSVASEVGSLSRWLLASLLTINGGAALAVASAAETLPANVVQQSIGLFAAGLILALFSAFSALLTGAILGNSIGQAMGAWTFVAMRGEGAAHAMRETMRLTGRSWRLFTINAALGALSAVAFRFGAFSAISGMDGMAQIDRPESALCRGIAID